MPSLKVILNYQSCTASVQTELILCDSSQINHKLDA